MHLIDAIILGAVEGLTEFLPVSSTGHLILMSSILNLDQTAFVKTFEIVIQLGAILAVVILFWKRLLQIEVVKRVIVGFVPTGIIGLALYHYIKEYLVGNITVVLASLLVGGVALILFENFHKESGAEDRIEDITYKQAALIGLFQAVAIVPGISRSAATIVGGLALGISRRTIVEFSFLLAVPTMLAASGLDLLKSAGSLTLNDAGILITGFAIAFVIALFSIRFLLDYVRQHDFIPFGVYRIVLAILFFFIAA